MQSAERVEHRVQRHAKNSNYNSQSTHWTISNSFAVRKYFAIIKLLFLFQIDSQNNWLINNCLSHFWFWFNNLINAFLLNSSITPLFAEHKSKWSRSSSFVVGFLLSLVDLLQSCFIVFNWDAHVFSESNNPIETLLFDL